MKNLLISFMCVWLLSACVDYRGGKTEFANTGSLLLAAPVECNVSGYSNNQWLNPDPVKQLGAVPVKGTPMLPSNKTPGTSENCDFHIFSWQWFLYLMNPYHNSANKDLRNFENNLLYPVVDLDTCSGIKSGATGLRKQYAMSPSVLKVVTMPDIPGQAGSGAALYDKNTSLVFYNRTFTKNECGIYASGNFPVASGVNKNFPTQVNQVLELKSSWRILGANDDKTKYYLIDADIEGVGKKQLGMVGFHVVVNTGAHPEFVWATFEHIDNAPDCKVVIPSKGFTRKQPVNGWSLASASCNACISTNFKNGADLKTLCKTQCDFNNNKTKPVYDSQGNVLIHGGAGQTPSNICLDAYYGEAPVPQNASNVPNIQFLNTLLVGPQGILTQLKDTDPMAVFKNYYLGGAEWTDVSKITSSSQLFNTEIAGSAYLANATMESFTQAGANTFFEKGCFSCHGGASGQNTAQASHLLTSAPGKAPGLIDRCDVKAGPIFDNAQAQQVCPGVCENAMGWNQNWKRITSQMAVCGCNACPSP